MSMIRMTIPGLNAVSYHKNRQKVYQNLWSSYLRQQRDEGVGYILCLWADATPQIGRDQTSIEFCQCRDRMSYMSILALMHYLELCRNVSPFCYHISVLFQRYVRTGYDPSSILLNYKAPKMSTLLKCITKTFFLYSNMLVSVSYNVKQMSEKSDTTSSVQTMKDSSYSTSSFASSSQQQIYQKTIASKQSQNVSSNVTSKVNISMA